MSHLPIILASSSPQRKALLAEAGYEFETRAPSDSAEYGICSNCGPAELVVDLATRKAADVARQLDCDSDVTDRALVIACDTVAECDGVILGKPRDEDDARTMLQWLRGKRHRVYSGLCLWPLNGESANGGPQTRLAQSELVMDNLSCEAIDEYLDTGLWRGKAGAFGLQDRPGWLTVISGSHSNVIGLPMELLAEMIAPIQGPIPG